MRQKACTMAELINLRQYRKQAARDAKRRSGAEAAARHGQSKTERHQRASESAKAQAYLDGHKRSDTSNSAAKFDGVLPTDLHDDGIAPGQ
ncbi:MAG: DUF4169 family protein [Roseinatronobacter sp.]